MGIDHHLNMSITSGLINDFHGASNFINDEPDPGQVAYTFIIRAKVREEHLDLEKLLSQQVPRLVGEKGEEESEPDATHIVTSVYYGVEAYCIFVQNVDGGEANEETKQEIIQQLAKIAMEWQSALRDFKDLDQFKQQLYSEQRHQVTRIKCRLYTDLQVEPVVLCGFFDAYKQSLELTKTMFKKETGNNMAIPIVIRLCPLTCLVDPIEDEKKFHYRDIDDNLVSGFSAILVGWKRVLAKAEKMRIVYTKSADCYTLREFIDTILKYQKDFQQQLQRCVPIARRYKMDDILIRSDIYNAVNSLFKPSQLEKWLEVKEAEMDVVSWLATVSGMTILTRSQLSERLSLKTFSLALFVPSLSEETNIFLEAMKSLVDFVPLVPEPSIGQINEDWYTVKPKRKLVRCNIREFANHVKKNKQLMDQVEFIVTFGENSEPFGCSYSVYEGDTLLKSNLRRLPDPPSGLQIQQPPVSRKAKKRAKMSTSSVRVVWDYEKLGYPCHFLVECRVKNGSDSWIQLRTTKPDKTQMTITFETGQTLEIRVAADTCIGRSDFSDVIDTESVPIDAVPVCVIRADKSTLHPPINLRVKSVTRTTAELERTLQPGNLFFCTRILYWKEEEGSSCSNQMDLAFKEPNCLLEDLEPETTYEFNMTTFADDWTNSSLPSKTLTFTTLARDVRFAEKLVERSKKIGKENGLDLFSVPLTKLDGRFKTAERFVFGEQDVNKKCPHRTILLVGTSADTVNCMVNYIFDVSPKDPFRFQLIDPSLEESRFRIYDIHHAKGLRIGYSLTVIVAPKFYEQYFERNRKFACSIRDFFEEKSGIQKLNLIGLVMDSSEPDLMSLDFYLYNLLKSIFGSKVKDKINFLLDCANKEEILDDVILGLKTPMYPLYQKYNSSALLSNTSERKDVSFCLDFLDNLFTNLEATTTKIATLPKQKLDEKNRLEAVVYGLKNRIKRGVALMEDLRKIDAVWDLYEKDVEFEVDLSKAYRVELPFGEYVTNCTKCQMTCHVVCGTRGDTVDCGVMDHSLPEEIRTCRVCPGGCLWSVHRNESTRFEYRQQRKHISFLKIKEKFERARKGNGKPLTWENFRSLVQKEMGSQGADVLDMLVTILDVLFRLNEMTYWDWNPLWVDINKYVVDVIGKLICFEEMDEREGSNERMDALKTLRVMAEKNFLLMEENQEDSNEIVKEEETVDGGEEEETNSS